jgi:hypothetical protein
MVADGEITLEEPASAVEIGLAYAHIIEPLPPNVTSPAGSSRKLRLVQASFRVKDTAALRLDVGRGLRDISLRQFNEDPILDEPPPLVSGDIRVRALGWQSDRTRGLWRIEQETPLPFTLLSVDSEIKVND